MNISSLLHFSQNRPRKGFFQLIRTHFDDDDDEAEGTTTTNHCRWRIQHSIEEKVFSLLFHRDRNRKNLSRPFSPCYRRWFYPLDGLFFSFFFSLFFRAAVKIDGPLTNTHQSTGTRSDASCALECLFRYIILDWISWYFFKGSWLFTTICFPPFSYAAYAFSLRDLLYLLMVARIFRLSIGCAVIRCNNKDRPISLREKRADQHNILLGKRVPLKIK